MSEVKRYWERKALINHDFIDKPYGDERNRCLNISETGWTEYVLASDHDRVVAELNKRIERLEAALNEIANYGATLDGVVAFSMKQTAREALEVEKK